MVQAQITIREALEAAIATAGNKPVDQSDAAAIQAAEVRATGSNVIAPGGVGAAAQSAAAFNAGLGLDRDEDKIKLADVLTVRFFKTHWFIRKSMRSNSKTDVFSNPTRVTKNTMHGSCAPIT